MKLKIGHMADLHIGTGASFGTINPETGYNTFTERQLEAALYSIAVMAAEGCDFLVIAGDLSDHPDPSSAIMQALQRIIDLAVFKGMTVIVMTGNHDELNERFNAVRALWRPSDTNVFYVDKDTAAEFPDVSFRMHDQDAPEGEPDSLQIGLYHGIVPGCTAGHIKLTRDGYTVGKGLHAIIAGDVHQHQELMFDGRMHYYSGSNSRLNFGEKDYDPGFGIMTVDFVDDGYDIDYKHLSTAHASYKFVELEVPGEVLNAKPNTVYKITGPEHMRESVTKQIAAGGGSLYSYIVKYEAGSVAKSSKREDMSVVSTIDNLEAESVIKDFLRGFVKAPSMSGLRGDYRLSQLDMRGFGSYEDASIGFSSEDLSYLVVGDNGAGKSLIFDAVRCCLVGSTYRGLLAGWAVRNRQAFLGVTLVGEKTVRVERTIEKTAGPGKHSIAIFIDGIEQKFDRISDTQNMIQELMGISEDSFAVSTMIGSQDISLVDKSSSWRVDYLIDLFNLNGVDDAAEEISSKSKIAAAAFATSFNTYQALSDSLGKLQSEFPPQPDVFQLVGYESELATANAAMADIQAKINNKHAAVAAAAAHNQSLRDMTATAAREVTSCVSSLESAEAYRMAAQNRLSVAEEAQKKNVCSLCGSPSNPEHAAKHIQELSTALMLATTQELTAVNNLEAARTRLTEAGLNENNNQQDDTVDTTAEAAEMARHRETAAVYQAKVDEIKDMQTECLKHQSVIDATDTQLRYVQAIMAVDQAEVVKWDYITSKFNAAAIKQKLISGLAGSLNAEATAYLSRIFGQKVGVLCEASLQVTKSRSIPKFDIYVLRNGEKVPFEQYSKGERGAVRVAVDLAVSGLVADVNPARFKFLIFDEAFDNLTPARSDAVAEMVNELVAKRGSMFAVAHKLKISTKFGRTVSVENGDNGSVITQQ